MTTGAVSATTALGASTPASSSSKSSNQVSESEFLQLLVAQMEYQNPLQPTTNTQFVTQLAEMQTLTELEGIKSDLDKLVANSGGSSGSSVGSSVSSGTQK